MPQYAHAKHLTRIHWAGQNADTDIHIELYKGIVDGKFKYNALFQMLSPQRETLPDTNSYRIDRMGIGEIKARKSGDEVVPSRIANAKLNILVGVALYTQNVFDYQDNWTSPDRMRDIGESNGTLFAKLYDEAHIIQLIKCRVWKPDASLAGAFHDGISGTVQVKENPASIQEYEANAYALEAAHKAAVEELIKRDTPMGNMVTLVSPRVFSMLTHHPKLLNKDYSTNNGDFAQRRVVNLNGITVIESTAFPKGAITNHVLTDASINADFNVSADEAKHEMIIFDKQLALVTVTAKALEAYPTNHPDQLCNKLTTATMYNIGQRRPDVVAAIKVEKV